MITLRNVTALGLLLLVSGSCSKDFDQFEFTGEEGPGTGGTAYQPGYTGATAGTIQRSSGGSAFGGSKGGPGPMMGQGGQSDGSAGKTAATGGRPPGGGRPEEGPPGGGRPEDGGPGRPPTAGGTTSGGMVNGGPGKAGSPQAGSPSGTGGAASCPKDRANCGAGCVQLTTPAHCGSCANVCAAGFACVQGACACVTNNDCAAPGANGDGGQGGDGGAASASSTRASCMLGACVCGATRCATGQRCKANGSCG